MKKEGCNNMDAEARRQIDEMLDSFIKRLNHKESAIAITNWFMDDVLMEDIALDWIKKDSKEQTSELATGYVIGFLVCLSHRALQQIKVRQELSKTSSEQVKEGTDATVEKKEKITFVRITKKDDKDIKEIIKPKIPKIRTEVYRALGK
jgi:hypothetical protein